MEKRHISSERIAFAHEGRVMQNDFFPYNCRAEGNHDTLDFDADPASQGWQLLGRCAVRDPVAIPQVPP